MASNTPFVPQGNTISLTTSSTPSTSQSRQITPANFGLGSASIFPAQVRVVSRGTGDLWINFTTATGTIVIPTPGTTTVGTPQLAIIIIPGAIEVFTLPTGSVLWVQDISTVASQTYHLLIGEGQ